MLHALVAVAKVLPYKFLDFVDNSKRRCDLSRRFFSFRTNQKNDRSSIFSLFYCFFVEVKGRRLVFSDIIVSERQNSNYVARISASIACINKTKS